MYPASSQIFRWAKLTKSTNSSSRSMVQNLWSAFENRRRPRRAWCFCCGNEWWLLRACRGLCNLSWQSVSAKVGRKPDNWSPIVQALSPLDCVWCVWVSRSVVDDRVRRRHDQGAENFHWMAFRPAIRRVIVTNQLSRQQLVEAVPNGVAEWQLILSWLNETGQRNNTDSFVVESSLPFSFYNFLVSCVLHFCRLEQRRGKILLRTKWQVWYFVSSTWRWESVSMFLRISMNNNFDYLSVPVRFYKHSRNTLVCFLIYLLYISLW